MRAISNDSIGFVACKSSEQNTRSLDDTKTPKSGYPPASPISFTLRWATAICRAASAITYFFKLTEELQMLAYTTLGVSDFERAKSFYEALLAVIGAQYVLGNERIALFGHDVTNPMLAVCIPYDEGEPSAGNGTMVAIRAGGPAECDAMYEKAIELGATCDGPPGERSPGFFYGGYVRDPDGNKLCFCQIGPQ
jgi:predicted lactoylglutathione lyase